MNITGHMEVCWTAFHVSFVVYLSTGLPEGPRLPVSACFVCAFLHPALIWGFEESSALSYEALMYTGEKRRPESRMSGDLKVDKKG